MSEEVVQLEASVEQAEDKLEQAKETGSKTAIDAAEARLRRLEDRLAKLEAFEPELRQGLEGKAGHDHEHPHPAHLKGLLDELEAIEAEERKPEPKKKGFLHRRIF